MRHYNSIQSTGPSTAVQGRGEVPQEVVRVLDNSISVVRVLENLISVQDQEIVHIAEGSWI